MGVSVFISYSSNNFDFVKRLQIKLSEKNVDTWFDSHQLASGDILGAEIKQAIESSSHLIAVICFDALASEWVEKEIKYARHCGIKVIPILVGDVTINHARHIVGKDIKYLNVSSLEELDACFENLLTAINKPIVNLPAYENTDDIDSQLAQSPTARFLTKFHWTGRAVPEPSEGESWELLKEVKLARSYPSETGYFFVDLFLAPISLIFKDDYQIRKIMWMKEELLGRVNGDYQGAVAVVVNSNTQNTIFGQLFAPPITHSDLIQVQRSCNKSNDIVMTNYSCVSFWDFSDDLAYELTHTGKCIEHNFYRKKKLNIWKMFRVYERRYRWSLGCILNPGSKVLSSCPQGNNIIASYNVSRDGFTKTKLFFWRRKSREVNQTGFEKLFEVEFPSDIREGSVDWSPSSNFVGFIGFNSVWVLDINKQKFIEHFQTESFKLRGAIKLVVHWHLAWHPSKDIYAISTARLRKVGDRCESFDCRLRFIRAESGDEIYQSEIEDCNDITSIKWSPDGRYIATSNWDGSAIIWDLKLNEFKKLVGKAEILRRVCFSPDGSRLVIQGLAHDNSISIWDHKNMIKLDEFDGYLDNFSGNIWHYDGQMLAYQIDKKTVGIRKLSF